MKQLIKEQFPQWADLPVYPVEKSGHDNVTFHLGDTMTVRLPSGKDYAPQVDKEITWLPKLKEKLSFPISCSLAKGEPTSYYPYSWSINQWIEGDTVNYDNILDLNQLAVDLALFLKEFQAIDASLGPKAGKHNFYRGGDLSIYHDATQTALAQLGEKVPTEILQSIWNTALQTKWNEKDVWVHGDIAPGNLLVKQGILCAIIDFGILGVGDPACDYAMAWTFFDKNSRKVFLETLECDINTWNRGKAWALWKALITYESEEIEIAQNAKRTILEIVENFS